MRIKASCGVCVLLTGVLCVAPATAGEKLNDARSAATAAGQAYSTTRKVIGPVGKPGAVTTTLGRANTAVGLGSAAVGFSQGAKQGYNYQQWQKPNTISPHAGGRTLGYFAGERIRTFNNAGGRTGGGFMTGYSAGRSFGSSSSRRR